MGLQRPRCRVMVTYFGSSEHGLDDKGRLILPGRILDEIPKVQWKFHLTAGLDRCLLLHDSEGFRELVDRIGRAVPGSRAHRTLCRRFLGHSEEVVPDGNRRIRIPEPLLKYAGLAASQPAVLVGTGRVTEIWAPHNLDTALTEASTEEETLFASLVGSTKPSTPTGSSEPGR
jgi:division/cell wall cluster transcriptional repressor MraZ